MPAQAGIHLCSMNFSATRILDSGVRRNDGRDRWALFSLFKTFSVYRAIDPRIILASVRIRVI